MISVIVPVLNEERFVGRLLKSLECQSFRDFEVLVVDGGSTDDTVKIARQHGTEILRSQRRISVQRNDGAKFASGGTLFFTEADVILPLDHLAKLVELFKEGAGAVAGSGIPYDANLPIQLEYDIYNAFRYVTYRLFRSFQSSGYNMAVRRDIFKRIGGFPNVVPNDDGLLGRMLAKTVRTVFSLRIPVLISSRRARMLGFWHFQQHYVFMLENIMPFLTPAVNRIREVRSRAVLERDSV